MEGAAVYMMTLSCRWLQVYGQAVKGRYTIGAAINTCKGNQNAEKQMVENLPIDPKRNSTAARLGKEVGVSGFTVKQAEKFAQGAPSKKVQNGPLREKGKT